MRDKNIITLELISIVLTILVGILALTSESISKGDYVVMWLLVLLHEVARVYPTRK
jgi:hypothetical protein